MPLDYKSSASGFYTKVGRAEWFYSRYVNGVEALADLPSSADGLKTT